MAMATKSRQTPPSRPKPRPKRIAKTAHPSPIEKVAAIGRKTHSALEGVARKVVSKQGQKTSNPKKRGK